MGKKDVCTTKETAKYLGRSPTAINRKKLKDVKALQSTSSYKKRELLIKESEGIYILENNKVKTPEPFFHMNSTWIYNADILKTESIRENSIDFIIYDIPSL